MSQLQELIINGNSLSLRDVVNLAHTPNLQVRPTKEACEAIEDSRSWVENASANGKVIYGITTGFGSFKNKVISPQETSELQHNLIRSHACGVGDPFSKEIVRAIMLLRANSLAKGFSGCRVELIEKLLELINKDIYPYVPSQGSVGSSGDLAPLCHIALVLIGEGECFNEKGERAPTLDVLNAKGIAPLSLEAKEGLALSNGTNVQTAVLALAVHEASILVDYADIIAALSVEVLMGSRTPFYKKISEVRNHPGQIAVAANIWSLLEKSPIIDSHKDCDRVQDSYSLRCVPQVHGAVRDTLKHSLQVVVREINAATDNPLIFTEDDASYSGGNFHGEPIAMAADILKIAVAEIANIAERRTAKMIDPAFSEGLPAFLINPKKGGLHSGLMIPQYVSAALVSENKVLAHPASVDSIPTSANQEDHVSMGTIAARQVYMMIQNARRVLAIELLNNTQAYEFRNDVALSDGTRYIYDKVRAIVPPIDGDRVFYKNMDDITELLRSDEVLRGTIAKAGLKNWNFSDTL